MSGNDDIAAGARRIELARSGFDAAARISGSEWRATLDLLDRERALFQELPFPRVRSPGPRKRKFRFWVIVLLGVVVLPMLTGEARRTEVQAA